jgi:hypothetical protein
MAFVAESREEKMNWCHDILKAINESVLAESPPDSSSEDSDDAHVVADVELDLKV